MKDYKAISRSGSTSGPAHKQGGATLIIFIAILLLLMLLSVHIQEINITEQKTSYNLKYKSEAQKNARYAMRYAQSWIESQTKYEAPEAKNRSTLGNETEQVWSFADETHNPANQIGSWWNNNGKQANSKIDGTGTSDSDARYVIEEYHHTLAGESSYNPNSTLKPVKYTYRITARGTSDSEGVQAIFQSTYQVTFFEFFD